MKNIGYDRDEIVDLNVFGFCAVLKNDRNEKHVGLLNNENKMVVVYCHFALL